MTKRDITDENFGLLVAIREVPNYGAGATWLCKCACGREAKVRKRYLLAGGTKSCGCLRSAAAVLRIQKTGVPDNTKHGHGRARAKARTTTYVTWMNMIQRTTNPKNPAYGDYGGRGITVCERWREFPSFLADMGERPSDLTLDRIDNDGDYEPTNCRWATWQQQAANRRPRKQVEA